jgi:hypothetical protein
MRITANNHWRHFKYSYEVPESVFSYYDWLSEDESLYGWIHYRNEWYHVSQFMRYADYSTQHFKRKDSDKVTQWHAYSADTYFSGLIIRISEDGEQYQIGRYYS